MSVTIRTNLPDFRKQLQKIGQDMQRRAVRNALAAMGRIFKAAAQVEAPVLKAPTRGSKATRVKGALKRNIIVKRSKYQARGAERYFVGVRSGKTAVARGGGDPFYWRFLEAGWIPRGPGRALRGGNRSRALQRSRLRSAGTTAVKYPFLQPAFDANQQRAIKAFEAAIDRAVVRYNRQK